MFRLPIDCQKLLTHRAYRGSKTRALGVQHNVKNHLEQSLLAVVEDNENLSTIRIHKNSKQSTTTNIFKNSLFEMNDGSNHTYFLGETHSDTFQRLKLGTGRRHCVPF